MTTATALDPKTSQKILVVDDSDIFRGALSETLERMGYAVSIACNGREAQDLIGLGSFDCVISDIRMEPVNGIELLRFIKATRPMPVILMTGFSELIETQEAATLGVEGLLAKPFKIEEVQKILTSLWASQIQAPIEAENLDDFYCKLSIDDFVSGREIKYDIFVRVSEKKYLKVAHQGEDVSLERIKIYKAKGLTHLFMRKEDFKKYLGLNIAISQHLKANPAITKEKKVNFMKHTSELLMEEVFMNGIDASAFEQSKIVLETTLSILSESDSCFDLLSTLNTHSNSVYAHSLGVSLYSVMIAKKLEWNSPSNLSKIAMAGMFHDVGKKELDPALLRKARQSFTREERHAYETHPLRGMEILGKIRGVSGDVLQAILQHHENCSGTGFPAGLKKSRIHPFARLLAVSNEFCNLVIEGSEGPPMPAAEAVSRLQTLYSETLDGDYLKALESVLK